MKELLYWIVEWIAKIHSHILRLNDAYEYNFTDKELHFLVIGMMGMGFIFVVYPVFKWLTKHDQDARRQDRPDDSGTSPA